MTTNWRTPLLSDPAAEQLSQHAPARLRRRGVAARLATALGLAGLLALGATGCGHHLHVTFHAGQEAGWHVRSPGR